MKLKDAIYDAITECEFDKDFNHKDLWQNNIENILLLTKLIDQLYSEIEVRAEFDYSGYNNILELEVLG
jgi:hypothetical protein